MLQQKEIQLVNEHLLKGCSECVKSVFDSSNNKLEKSVKDRVRLGDSLSLSHHDEVLFLT